MSRHQKAVANPQPTYTEGWYTFDEANPEPTAEVKSTFKHLRYERMQHSDTLKRLIECGIRLSHLYISCMAFEDEEEEDFLEVLANQPEAARHITCLSIGTVLQMWYLDDWMRDLRSLTEGTLLANLTELRLFTSGSSGVEERMKPVWTERDLGRLLAGMVSMRALRVVQIEGASHTFHSKDLLINAEFPPALEHVRLFDLYYRFVTAHPSGGTISTPAGGKRGRLQAIPSLFRKNITAEGVWEYAPNAILASTFLNYFEPARP